MLFEYKTPPLDCQRAFIDDHAFDPGYALWWEMGVGKSKALIDNAAKLYCENAITGFFVLAPNGLHRNFVTRELPKHLPDAVAERTQSLIWRTNQTKAQDNAARELLKHDGLKVLAMSYDSIMTEKGRALAKEFLTSNRCLYGADETGRIKEPAAARTVRVVGSGPFAAYRRGLTGTPIANAPWDIWSQIKFLDEGFWAPHGLDSHEAMKAQFGIWEKTAQRVAIGVALHARPKLEVPEEVRITYKVPLDKNGKPTGMAFRLIPRLQRSDEGRPQYKNLDRLRTIVAPIRSRVLKKDVLTLPPKRHSMLEFDLAPGQRRAYDSMQKLGFALTETGESCTASMALTALLRLQQIACGYLVVDITPENTDEPRVRPIDPNPRLDLLLELTQDMSHPALIWARFRADIDAIVTGLRKQGKKVARYDGAISDEECGENEDAFHRGDVQFLALTQSKGGEGLTLIEAETAIYYSNSFKLIERLQSSDRLHRFGQTKSVLEIDLFARDTMEAQLILALQNKYDMSCMITGDQLKDWLLPMDRFL